MECFSPCPDPRGEQMEEGSQHFPRIFRVPVMRLESTSAPAVFQALVSSALQDMLNRFLFVYTDDILILCETLEEHIQHF